MSPGLVGRASERERLLSIWGEAQEGARFVVVVGEAGVGKTRLVADLVGAVRRQDAIVVTTRCFVATLVGVVRRDLGTVYLTEVSDCEMVSSPEQRLQSS